MRGRTEALAAFVAGGLLAAGSVLAIGHMTASAAPEPASCSWPALAARQDAGSMASGDAAILWLPGARAYAEFVCTDGTLVPVEKYGRK